MKKCIVLIGVLGGLFFTFKAQRVEVKWDGVHTIDYGFFQKKFPKFSHSGYLAEEDMVYIHELDSEGKKFEIVDLVWKKVNQNLYDLAINKIPQTEEIEYIKGKTEKGQSFFRVKILPFKRNGNQIYRLESFQKKNQSSTEINTKTQIASLPLFLGSEENPLKEGTYYKIKVDKSGIFKITKKFLTDNGINPDQINPKNFRIYGNGGGVLPEGTAYARYSSLQENAIQVVGQEDGVWNDEDYAIFYAQGPHLFGNTSKMPYARYLRGENKPDTSWGTMNIYDDYGYYFINFDKGEGKRIKDENIEISSGSTIFTRYDEYQYVNENKHNLSKVGRVWVGDSFNAEKEISFKARTPLKMGDVIRTQYGLVGFRGQGNNVRIDFNQGAGVDNRYVFNSNFEHIYGRFQTSNYEGDNLSIKFSPNINPNPEGTFYLDYVEFVYPQDLIFNGSQMNFRVYGIRDSYINSNFGFSMAQAQEVEQIWDISDITNAKRKVNRAGNGIFTFGYNSSSQLPFNNEFVAFKHTSAYTPTFVGRVENQDLSSLQNIDYVIVTRKDMMFQAQRLADYHKNVSGFKTAVVDVEKIYNEFSSGARDISALRDFFAYLKNKRGGLKYVLLLGDSSADFKNVYPNNDNIIPSYVSWSSSGYESSYISDDFYGLTHSENHYFPSHDFVPDLPVGRLPASNVEEAKLLIDKTLAYYNALPNQSSPFGDWRLNMSFVVDDNGEGGTPFHTLMDNYVKNTFENSSERGFYNLKKMYLDSYSSVTASGGQRFPAVNQAISSGMNTSLHMFYFGHGGVNGWAQERVLTTDEIKSMSNYNNLYTRFPFITTVTCEFSLWDDPNISSAGEQVIKHRNGGSAGMLTSSRPISVSYGADISKELFNRFFELDAQKKYLAVGDAFTEAKRDYKKNFGLSTEYTRINLLADPAMRVYHPKKNLTIDKIQTPEPGKIRALDLVKISGRVLDDNGNLNTGFNGKVSFNIFDKKKKKKTLNNDGGSELLPILEYTQEGKSIVKTSGKVVNGEYMVEFYVPKDIDYTLGEGRILAYADNFDTAKSSAFDVYENKNYTIGEINPNGISDNTPPKVKLYMNNTNFVNGGMTNSNPSFLACVTDDTGINSTGAGVGHDITLTLNGEKLETMVLNDFFTSGESSGCVENGLSDYQKGVVLYPLKNLKSGNHQLEFKIWDINNNSTTESLNFVVKSDLENKMTMDRLMNWPNPFTDKTYIHFEHNCDDILDVNVQIFTITGKLVKAFSKVVSSEPFMQGFRTPKYAIEWDGRDDYGNLVGKGTYIFKVLAKGQSPDKCTGSATAIEKMVILK